MNISETTLAGVVVIEPRDLQDERGTFIKVFHKDSFIEHGMAADFKESYYSVSKKDVIRGMHFQTPPAEHAKLVYVTSGAITDVVLDIRQGSPTFGTYITVELSAENHKVIYIPAGFAHGFRSLVDNTSVTYMQTSMYAPHNDGGIRFDSFEFDWGVTKPIMSKRDQEFPSFAEFESPFKFSA